MWLSIFRVLCVLLRPPQKSMGVTKVYRREKKSSTKALNGRLKGRASYLEVDAPACQTHAICGCDSIANAMAVFSLGQVRNANATPGNMPHLRQSSEGATQAEMPQFADTRKLMPKQR